MPSQQQPAYDAAQQPIRSGKPNLVAHPCPVIHHCEVVFMLKPQKRAMHHHIAEIGERPPTVDPAGMRYPSAKVPPAPLYRLALSNEAGRYSSNCLLLRLCRGRLVKVDTRRQLETSFYRSIYPRRQSNRLHSPPAARTSEITVELPKTFRTLEISRHPTEGGAFCRP
jgi:hypothetical protein